MSLLNRRVSDLKVSAIRAIKQKSEELKAQGRKVTDFGIGEPDFDTPEHIRAAAFEAMQAGHTRYTVTAGEMELRKALVQKFKNENGLIVSPEQILVSAGGRAPISIALESVLEEGDEVILLAPYWVTYSGLVHLARGKAVTIKASAENEYKVTPQQIADAITTKTKAIIFNSPSNPTGAVYSREEIRAIGNVLQKQNILVISDEMYEHYVYHGAKFHSFAAVNPEMSDRVLTANACSKTYAMTGWRLGYATGPTELIAGMTKYQGETVAHASSISQYAAIAALRGSLDFLKERVTNYSRRIELAASVIRTSKYLTLPHMPQGAFFVFVNCSNLIGKTVAGVTITNSDVLQNVILDKTGVIVISGSSFGDEQAFRVSVAVKDAELQAGLEQIVKLIG